MYTRTIQFLMNANNLSIVQFGFSCKTPNHSYLDEICSNFDTRMHTVGVFLDILYFKALDIVNHYGVKGRALYWV